jgi:hypothetical protein
MIIERTKKEIIIRLSSKVNTDDLQDFLNYARYTELTSGFSVSQKEVDNLSNKVNSSWWAKNKTRLTK